MHLSTCTRQRWKLDWGHIFIQEKWQLKVIQDVQIPNPAWRHIFVVRWSVTSLLDIDNLWAARMEKNLNSIDVRSKRWDLYAMSSGVKCYWVEYQLHPWDKRGLHDYKYALKRKYDFLAKRTSRKTQFEFVNLHLLWSSRIAYNVHQIDDYHSALALIAVLSEQEHRNELTITSLSLDRTQ